jgi:hypothetical protein
MYYCLNPSLRFVILIINFAKQTQILMLSAKILSKFVPYCPAFNSPALHWVHFFVFYFRESCVPTANNAKMAVKGVDAGMRYFL